MKRILSRIVVVGALALLISVSAGHTAFALMMKGNNVEIAADETIEDDLFVTAETLRILGTVQGDVYAAGALVEVEGTISGDLYVVGGTVKVSGNIGQDILIGGGDVRIEGATIGDSVVLAAGNAVIPENTKINGGMIFGAGTLDLSADITRNLLGGAGLITLQNEVQKNVFVGVDELRVKSGTNIGGDLTYYSSREANIATGALIAGDIIYNESTLKRGAEQRNAWEKFVDRLRGNIFAFLTALLIGSILIYIAPKHTQHIVQNFEKQPWWSLLAGLITLSIVPLASLLLFVTLIGAPLGLIVLFFLVLAVYLAKIYVGLVVGHIILGKHKKKINFYALLAVGLLIYYVATALPYVGPFVVIFGTVAAVGALAITQYQKIITGRKTGHTGKAS
ncbi:hypothetical protein COV82_05240 [Candidatus Peregrinibacteria bacterium CG11_big_fil_rev_8_21_14_0_20_46_8]|nr:MAG: hypothetical protein COV82_05240 [Candidatus Peregrinibacteria bacterium CG11_big_fil_rev_8_21_14_0_20_46_8]